MEPDALEAAADSFACDDILKEILLKLPSPASHFLSTTMAKKRAKRTMAENTMVNWSALRHDLVRVIGDLLLATNDVDSYAGMRAVCKNWRTAIPKPTSRGAGDDLRFHSRGAGAALAGWSDLPKDLVRVVADLLLATNDVDCYVDMRAVCHNWRLAIPKPTPLGAGDDGRFHPREWVMLDEKTPKYPLRVEGRLFLNLSTGRFLRLRLPQLDRRILVGASDGLLVLGDGKGLHAARLLNPFTGDMLSFAAPIPRENRVRTAVAGTNPTLLFTFQDWHDATIDMVYCAAHNSMLCEVQLEDYEADLGSAVSYGGHLYVVGYNGGIFKITGAAPDYRGELIEKTFEDDQFYLVVSAGQLLLVMQGCSRESAEDPFPLEVYRVDVDRKVLEPVTNIGSRALFLGDRCLSLDVNGDWPKSDDGNWLKALDGNCIYYFDYFLSNFNRYDLSTGKEERISYMFPETEIQIRPFSIAQTLLEYCCYLPDIEEQIKRRW